MKCWSSHLSLFALFQAPHQSKTTSYRLKLLIRTHVSCLDYLYLHVSITVLQYPKAISDRSIQLTSITSISFRYVLTLRMTPIWLSLLIVIPLICTLGLGMSKSHRLLNHIHWSHFKQFRDSLCLQTAFCNVNSAICLHIQLQGVRKLANLLEKLLFVWRFYGKTHQGKYQWHDKI